MKSDEILANWLVISAREGSRYCCPDCFIDGLSRYYDRTCMGEAKCSQCVLEAARKQAEESERRNCIPHVCNTCGSSIDGACIHKYEKCKNGSEWEQKKPRDAKE